MRRRLLTALVVTMVSAFGLASHAFGGVVLNERYSLTQFVTSCNGEFFQIEADIHQVNRVTTDAQGVEHLGVTFTSRFLATSPSGDRYIGVGQLTSQIGDGGGAGATTGTITNSGMVILRGEDGGSDDQTFRSIVHFTFKPNGELVASLFRITFDCT